MALEDLKTGAITTGQALRQAVEWLRVPANEERVGSGRRSLEREIRRLAVSADKLAAASDRLMCVSVFGPSQVGKSHLVSVLAAPTGKELMAVFDGQPDTSYIRKINPDKGKEATGLVTRFTTQSMASPPNYPVCLRLLSHADIIKILCNGFFVDGKANKYEAEQVKTINISEHIAKFQALATGQHNNGLKIEDIWDLQDYVRTSLGEFSFYRKIDPVFWDAAGEIVSKLEPQALPAFFEVLWNRHEAITSLYTRLIAALRALNFADNAFCPLDAITEETRIIDVDALKDLVSETGDMIGVATASGVPAQMPRAILAALTAELRIVVRERAWDFQRHTDILDFPGYRTRGLSGLEEEHEGKDGLAGRFIYEKAVTLKNIFLRGKVDYLFQRYVAEQELTGMMLCIKESNLEVETLPTVVNDWIGRTHGPSPAERVGKPVLLFFILTRFDLMLKEKANESEADPVANFEGRMNASLIDKFSAHSWPSQWVPEKPFNNMFLMRSPAAKSELFQFDADQEIGLRPEVKERVDTLRDAFASAPLVKTHFADPTRAFNEMMKAADGGTGYIVENLSKVCLPNTKQEQIKTRLLKIVADTHEKLNRFHIATDVDKRLAESEAAAQEAIDAIYDLLNRGRFATFLHALMVESGSLASHLQQVIVSGGVAEEPSAGSPQSNLPRPGAGLPRPGSNMPRPGAPAPVVQEVVAEPQVAKRDLELARAAVEFWISSVQEQLSSDALRLYLQIDETVMRRVGAELQAAAQRTGLPMMIARELGSLSHIELFDQHIAKACVLAEQRINRFVAQAGFNYTAESQRPVNAEGKPVFAAAPIRFSAAGLSDQVSDTAQSFTIDWIYAFFEMVRANAMSERGQTFDVEQNRRLGEILLTLDGVKA